MEALSAVLADAASEGALELLCLGDLVGYGADPIACVERVGERASAMVAGNHEHGALGLLDLRWFNPWARAAAEWTGEQLDQGHRDYLAGLPLIRAFEDATLVHSSPRNPEEWEYLVTAEEGLQVFGDFATRLCFIGHSHLPGVWSVGSGGPHHTERLETPEAQVRLDDGRRAHGCRWAATERAQGFHRYELARHRPLSFSLDGPSATGVWNTDA